MYKQPENQAYEVPLCERLDVVPLDTRLIIEDKSGLGTSFIPIGSLANKTAAELRRLHQVNQELVKALEKLARLGNGDQYGNSEGNMIARAILAKHKEQA